MSGGIFIKVLVIAPHSDDEILGAGGTMAKHVAAGDEVTVCIVSNHDEPLYTKSDLAAIKQETADAHRLLGVHETIFLDFVAVLLREEAAYKVNGAINAIVEKVRPSVVYVPHFGDMHTDHRITAQASLVAVRPIGKPYIRRVYAYETLSETEWNAPHAANAFLPCVYSDISDYLDKKLEAMSLFRSQLHTAPHPRSLPAMRALAQLRGSTIGVNAAEAFYTVREIL